MSKKERERQRWAEQGYQPVTVKKTDETAKDLDNIKLPEICLSNELFTELYIRGITLKADREMMLSGSREALLKRSASVNIDTARNRNEFVDSYGAYYKSAASWLFIRPESSYNQQHQQQINIAFWSSLLVADKLAGKGYKNNAQALDSERRRRAIAIGGAVGAITMAGVSIAANSFDSASIVLGGSASVMSGLMSMLTGPITARDYAEKKVAKQSELLGQEYPVIELVEIAPQR